MNTHADSVTIVMPCYNGLPYLPQALASAVAQTHRPEAIIVVDDGSKDDSAQIVRGFAAEHSGHNIQLIQQANAGEPAARNTGIRAARTAWVAMLDTDDWWDPRKLELQLAAAEEAGPDCVLVHTGWTVHQQDGGTIPCNLDKAARRTGWCSEKLLEPISMAHPSIMVRRDALTKIGGYDASFKQACDIDLYWRLSAVGTFAFVPQRLLNYRRHDAQMSAHQADQVAYHHRAVRNFCAAHPQWVAKVGRANIDAALAHHAAVKLESLWWRRSLDDFRQLLAYADEQGLDSPAIRTWRRRGRLPDWLIRVKDRLRGQGRRA